MRKTTTVVAAAMAVALTAASLPSEATNNGLSEKQIRALIKKEVAKIPRGPRGPAGPTGAMGPEGPAGMDGFPSLLARVVYGEVDASRSVGITQENVRIEESEAQDDQGMTVVSTTYCFIGLPPVMGGQVTTDGHEGSGALVSPKLQLNPFDPECPIRVWSQGRDQFVAVQDSFHILLY